MWECAAAIAVDEHDGQLPFKIIALPLLTFLETPDWSTAPSARWESLFDPAQTKHFGRQPKKAGTPASQSTALATTTDPSGDQEDATLPEPLRRRTASDDRRIMKAYYQHVIEQGPALAHNDAQPRPDRAFFEVMSVYSSGYFQDSVGHSWIMMLLGKTLGRNVCDSGPTCEEAPV